MASFNRIILLGNLTRDPTMSYTPNQTAVVDFGLATNRRWTAQDGTQKEDVCFVDCKAFGKRAENINKWCDKGTLLLIEGRLAFHSWQQDDGHKRSKLEVVVENFSFIPMGEKEEQINNKSQKQEMRPVDSDESDIPF